MSDSISYVCVVYTFVCNISFSFYLFFISTMLLLVRMLTIIYMVCGMCGYNTLCSTHLPTHTHIPSQCLGAYINCVVWWALLSVVLSVYQNLFFFYRYMVVICNACVAHTHTALTTKRWCRRSFCAAAAVAAAVICVVNVDALANTIAVSVCVVYGCMNILFEREFTLKTNAQHTTRCIRRAQETRCWARTAQNSSSHHRR